MRKHILTIFDSGELECFPQTLSNSTKNKSVLNDKQNFIGQKPVGIKIGCLEKSRKEMLPKCNKLKNMSENDYIKSKILSTGNNNRKTFCIEFPVSDNKLQPTFSIMVNTT